MRKNIVVLGAGPAGLTVAYELIHRLGLDCSVTIIEKDLYVGGLCRTVQAKHFSFDIGGHRYFSYNNEIVKWWKYFLSDEEFRVVDRFSHIVYHGEKIQYPISLSLSEMKALGFKESCKIAFDYAKAKLNPMPIESLEDFYVSHFGEELYHMFFESYTKKVCGQHPSAISPSWGYHRVGGLSISKILTGQHKKKRNKSCDMRTITDQFYYPKYGSGALWNQVAEELICSGVKLLLKETISSFEVKKNAICSIKCCSGYELPVDYIISTIPIKELLLFIPEVPNNIKAIGNELSYRNITVVSFLFRFECITGDLKKLGSLIPDQWLYIQDDKLKVSRIQLINNWSEDLIKEPDCVGLCLEFYTSKNDEFEGLDNMAWVELALSELSSLGYIEKASLPVEQAVFQKEKAYPCYHGSYKNINEIKQYIDTINNLVCIGRNGQHYYGNIDHVMETALRAADWITSGCDKRTVWTKE